MKPGWRLAAYFTEVAPTEVRVSNERAKARLRSFAYSPSCGGYTTQLDAEADKGE